MQKRVSRAIIFNNKRKVLLGKRARGKGKGQWALIGGRPNKNETDRDTIVREVQEELGLIFNPTFYKSEIDDFSNPGEIWQVNFFYGSIEGSLNINRDEIIEIIYVGEDDFSSLDIAFDHKEVLTQFFQDTIK